MYICTIDCTSLIGWLVTEHACSALFTFPPSLQRTVKWNLFPWVQVSKQLIRLLGIKRPNLEGLIFETNDLHVSPLKQREMLSQRDTRLARAYCTSNPPGGIFFFFSNTGKHVTPDAESGSRTSKRRGAAEVTDSGPRAQLGGSRQQTRGILRQPRRGSLKAPQTLQTRGCGPAGKTVQRWRGQIEPFFSHQTQRHIQEADDKRLHLGHTHKRAHKHTHASVGRCYRL